MRPDPLPLHSHLDQADVEVEEPSGIKTPLDIQDFEHLLPLFSTPPPPPPSTSSLPQSNIPPSNLTRSTTNILSLSTSPITLDLLQTHSPAPVPLRPIGPDQDRDRDRKERCLAHQSSDPHLLTPHLVLPRISQATSLRDQALSTYLHSAKNDSRREIDDQENCSKRLPLLEIIRPSVRSNSSNGFGPMRASSSWSGHQRSGAKSYSVSVKILQLDLTSGTGSGLLEIAGLTEKWPKLVTFFDIEIVGRGNHSFATGTWGATPQSDEAHWSRFPSYYQTAYQRTRLGIHNDLKQRSNGMAPPLKFKTDDDDRHHDPFLFMRWKERFLDGNPPRREIEGASFAGFYYACLDFSDQRTHKIETVDRSTNSPTSESYAHIVRSSPSSRRSWWARNAPTRPSNPDSPSLMRISTEPSPSPSQPSIQDWSHAQITAYYYHAKSEPYQELVLRPVPQSTPSGSSATYQFC